MSAARIFFLATLVAVSAHASGTPECGVGVVEHRALNTLRAMRASTPEVALAANATVEATAFQDGIVVLPFNERIVPFHNPFDLSGRSVRIRRLSASQSRVEEIPFAWNADLGAPKQHFLNASSVLVTLPFPFPFRDRTIQKVAMTRENAIWLDGSAPFFTLDAWGELEILSLQEPVISPLLLGDGRPGFEAATLYERTDASSAQYTWVSTGARGYRAQVTLESSGDIVMSWKDVTIAWGVPVVSAGASEPFRVNRTLLAEATTPSGDVNAGSVTTTAALDMKGVRVERLGTSPLVEIRIDLSGTPSGAAPQGQSLQYIAAFATEQTPAGSEPFVIAEVNSSGQISYFVSAWTETSGLASARIEGGDVILSIIDDHLPAGSTMEVLVGTALSNSNSFADATILTLDYSPGLEADGSFSAASGEWIDKPLYEAYTLGVLDPFAVAEQLRGIAGGAIDELDGVAIYPTFLTDIIFYAGAYAYSGNPVANGIGRGLLLDQPFSPTLMHMNTLGYGHNSTPNGAMRVLLHEFGHRWLYSPSIMVNGSVSKVLNPISAHPAQYVHAPAAFPFITDRDTSTMGGGWFEASGTGWSVPSYQTNFGYSWIDLYLMGMAEPQEIEPFFYLDGTNLGGAYYPPPGTFVTGTQRDVSVDSMIQATGLRQPGPASSKRRFRAVVVVIEDPAHPFTDEDRLLLDEHRRYVETSFSRATGNRGELTLDFFMPTAEPRRRGVRR